MLDIYFENNNTAAFAWEKEILIEETGMYYLWFVICDEELGAATVAGQTIWKNPTGTAWRSVAVTADLAELFGPAVDRGWTRTCHNWDPSTILLAVQSCHADPNA